MRKPIAALGVRCVATSFTAVRFSDTLGADGTARPIERHGGQLGGAKAAQRMGSCLSEHGAHARPYWREVERLGVFANSSAESRRPVAPTAALLIAAPHPPSHTPLLSLLLSLVHCEQHERFLTVPIFGNRTDLVAFKPMLKEHPKTARALSTTNYWPLSVVSDRRERSKRAAATRVKLLGLKEVFTRRTDVTHAIAIDAEVATANRKECEFFRSMKPQTWSSLNASLVATALE